MTLMGTIYIDFDDEADLLDRLGGFKQQVRKEVQNSPDADIEEGKLHERELMGNPTHRVP